MAYESVNGQWPEGTNEGRNIRPTPEEAISAVKRLYRKAMGRPWQRQIKLTSGLRHTGIRSGVLYVNPDHTWDRGWHGIVHGLSHHASWRLYHENHGPRHAFIEKELIAYVVKSGWLDGKLRRPEKAKGKPDRIAVRMQSIETRIAKWEAKRKRAETALKKLCRQQRYYSQRSAAGAGPTISDHTS